MAGALADVRVLDLSQRLAGPFGSMLFADLGADVIKIEPPTGDLTRFDQPSYDDELSAYFTNLNRNKRAIALDLRQPEGLQVFYDLVRISDVVWDNYRPGVTERLKIDYDTLKQINPRIICCSISGFGSSGPYREKPAYDLIGQALGGGMSLTGEPDGGPLPWAISIGDTAAGMFAAHAALAALHARTLTGVGQRCEVALLDGQIALLTHLATYYFATGSPPPRMGAGISFVMPWGVYPTADAYIVLCGRGENFWAIFCRACGLEELVDDPRFRTNADRVKNRLDLDRIISDRLRQKPLAEWLTLLEGFPCAPVYSIDEALSDPHIVHRGMVVEVDQPTVGPVRVLGNPLKLFGTPVERYGPAPRLSEHAREILAELLAYDDARIAEFAASGAVVVRA
ncbi:MAG: CoA transferase [Chloroflexi bacterium]|nr:CoA transferase [Chloroflexota bacterium]